MQRFKAVLSSLPAKIMIVPFALLYLMWSMGLPSYRMDFVMTFLGSKSPFLELMMFLSGLLLISVPHLIDRRWELRLLGVLICACSVVCPAAYFYLFFADGMHDYWIFVDGARKYAAYPWVIQLLTINSVAIVLLYAAALVSPPPRPSPEWGEELG